MKRELDGLMKLDTWKVVFKSSYPWFYVLTISIYISIKNPEFESPDHNCRLVAIVDLDREKQYL